jgi:hypothetical protein
MGSVSVLVRPPTRRARILPRSATAHTAETRTDREEDEERESLHTNASVETEHREVADCRRRDECPEMYKPQMPHEPQRVRTASVRKPARKTFNARTSQTPPPTTTTSTTTINQQQQQQQQNNNKLHHRGQQQQQQQQQM